MKRLLRLAQAVFLLLAGFIALLCTTPLFATEGLAQPVSPQPTVSASYWRPLPAARLAQQAVDRPLPTRYQLWQLDLPQMDALLASAPPEAAAAKAIPLIVTLPLSNGSLAEFAVVDTPVMEPALAAKFPGFRTLAGYAVDDAATTVRLGVTSLGFHATVWSVDGTTWIDPVSLEDTSRYIVYDKADAVPAGDFIESEPIESGPIKSGPIEWASDDLTGARGEVSAAAFGGQLLVYRTVVAATGEYTAKFGGTVEGGIAAIVTAMNRINGIYERDVAVRMVLIDGNEQVVYTNPVTDPYTNNNANAMLSENQTVLDNIFGNANYDVGHVFSTGGGGLAMLGVPCRTGEKALGVTGLDEPLGDPFYVDYVAHEFGHQFGAHHTFSSQADSCGGNRFQSTAWEPGSGSTIMAYAGICGPQNLQPNSDDYFHVGSIEEIVKYTRVGDGSTCPVIVPTGNSAPSANAGTGGFTIPFSTPFMLTGVGSDPDTGNVLTYNWEQFDTGTVAGLDNPPVGSNAPIIRSILPATSPTRIIPRIQSLINNTFTSGEILPTYMRSLAFRFTVRDNAVGGGGVDSAPLSFSVTNGAGPFVVTDPNTAISWTGGNLQTVTWNVANTNVAPVNCATVSIWLSLDGGFTYPYRLAASVPNTGSAQVTAPDAAIPAARVMVRCATSIFFDISNTNFAITGLPPRAILEIQQQTTPAQDSTLAPGASLAYNVTVSNTGTLTGTVTITDLFPEPLTNVLCGLAPGNLSDLSPLGIGAARNIACTAVVDPAATIMLSHTPSKSGAVAGDLVDFTIAVTNPYGVALQNVVVTSNHGVACTPGLGVPFTLAPFASAAFVCANIVMADDVTYTATATGILPITNQAQASSPHAPDGPVVSNPVSHIIALSSTKAASVTHLQPAQLVVGKSAVPAGALAPGQTITYTIRVTNTGDVGATATLTDLFAAPLTNPQCAGVTGNLSAVRALAAQSSTQIVCTAVVDPSLILAMQLSASREVISPGALVTYTVVLTNPNAVALEQVVVSAPWLGPSCTGAPGTPTTLVPGASVTYVCPNVVGHSPASASASAQVAIHNQASASAPEVAGAPKSSEVVTRQVMLAATADVTIEIVEPDDPDNPIETNVFFITPISR